MIKSCLFIVPHPDDEINIGGGIFEQLHDAGVETHVVVCTNGDFVPELALQRFKETTKVQRLYKYEHLDFLGYGDDWQGTHIYDLKGEEIGISHCGKTETYAPKGYEEYCYKKYRTHHSYTRENFKNDIKDVILDFRADLIISVDLDSHPDHRCVSLLFEEAMGEILKQEKSYTPIVLKGFAYLGKWNGEKDFFNPVLLPAISEGKDADKCFPYRITDRLRIAVPKRNYSLLWTRSNLFKSMAMSRSQSAMYREGWCGLISFPKMANPENVYWHRRTDNLALNARIDVSSGNGYQLNDFKVFETTNIRSNPLLKNALYWSPDSKDEIRSAEFHFSSPTEIDLIRIYQNPEHPIKNIRISIGNELYLYRNLSVSAVIEIPLSGKKQSSAFRIEIEEMLNDRVEIGEIELYGSAKPFPWEDLPFKPYEDRYVRRSALLCRISRKLYHTLVYGFLIKRNAKMVKKLMYSQGSVCNSQA